MQSPTAAPRWALTSRGRAQLGYRRRSWRRSRRAPAPGSTVRNRVKALLRNRVKALHGGCPARFLKSSFEGNDRRSKESPDLYCRDVTALRRRVRRISPKSKISSPGLRYWECLGLPFGDVIAHLKVPDIVLCLKITLGLHLSPYLLTIINDRADK
jgi:hypothetical protein